MGTHASRNIKSVYVSFGNMYLFADSGDALNCTCILSCDRSLKMCIKQSPHQNASLGRPKKLMDYKLLFFAVRFF